MMKVSQGRHFLLKRLSLSRKERQWEGEGDRHLLAKDLGGGSRGGDVGVRFYIYREECLLGFKTSTRLMHLKYLLRLKISQSWPNNLIPELVKTSGLIQPGHIPHPYLLHFLKNCRQVSSLGP